LEGKKGGFRLYRKIGAVKFMASKGVARRKKGTIESDRLTVAEG
jgi:hypothetical protein